MMELRAHQKQVIVQTRQAIIEGSKRPLMVAPCSFGKTIVAAEISHLAIEKGKKVLFLVHRRLLAIQTKEKFDAYGLHSSIIMAGEETDFSADIMIATVQTYSRRLELDSPDANQFFLDADIIFCDEAHLGISPTYKKIYAYYQNKILIGMTGSPARGDQRGLGEVFDCLVESITIKELTKQGFLAPIRYYAGEMPDLESVKIQLGDYHKGQLQEKMNKSRLVGDVVENWLRVAQDRPTIVFSTGVKHSISLRDEFEKNGITAAHLDSRSPHEERMDVLNRFRKGEIRVVTNCQLFCEGYDADFVSCIVVARPTKSLPLWIQMAGRGQRIFEGKIDTILMDHGGNVERHGLLDEDIVWSLDGKEKAWKKLTKKKKEDKEPKLVKCLSCNLVFSGLNECPDCGSPIKSFGKKVEIVEADLKEVKSKKATFVEKRRFYGMARTWVSRQKNSNPNRVAGAYKGKFGVWPRNLDNTALIEPDQSFLNYMKYQMISYAKGMKK